MDFDRLFQLADRSRGGKRFAVDDADFVSEAVPAALRDFPNYEAPAKIRHPAGFTVEGAPVGTFMKAALLLCGQRVFGKRYEGSGFFSAGRERVGVRRHALAFSPWPSEGDALLRPMHACRLSGSCIWRDQVFRHDGTG